MPHVTLNRFERRRYPLAEEGIDPHSSRIRKACLQDPE